MNKAFVICITLATFCLLSVVESADPAPWTPVDWKTLPKAKPTDSVDVEYLVAPLLEDSYGRMFALLKLYHGAIAFTNRNTNFSITINYDASDFFRATLFPEIITLSNGTKELVWENGGANYIYLGVNYTYWTEIDKVATISGSIYNDFIENWNAKINDTQPFYNMFGVMDHYKGKLYLPSWDCFDYVWEAFNQLHVNGAIFAKGVTPKRNFVDLYSSTPPLCVTDLYYSEPKIRAEIIDFYELTQASFKSMSFGELIVTLLEVFEGTFYLRFSDDYFKIQIHFPFAGFHWDPAALPGYGMVENRNLNPIQPPKQKVISVIN